MLNFDVESDNFAQIKVIGAVEAETTLLTEW